MQVLGTIKLMGFRISATTGPPSRQIGLPAAPNAPRLYGGWRVLSRSGKVVSWLSTSAISGCGQSILQFLQNREAKKKGKKTKTPLHKNNIISLFKSPQIRFCPQELSGSCAADFRKVKIPFCARILKITLSLLKRKVYHCCTYDLKKLEFT
jgi:hypothetical protein